jgi:enoyl-[acyl-carrier protein] reductase II
VLPRALRTPFVEDGNADPESVERDRERIVGELFDAVRGGRAHELVPFAGQTAGLIAGVEPAGEIVRSLVEGAQVALRDQLR